LAKGNGHAIGGGGEHFLLAQTNSEPQDTSQSPQSVLVVMLVQTPNLEVQGKKLS